MTAVKLKHVDRFPDRHGKLRYYFRRGKGARVPLVGEPGSPEFMASYQAALSGEAAAIALVPAKRGAEGTFNRLLQDYFASTDFLKNKARVQRAYRGVMERWVQDENIGHRLVREMRREHVSKMMSKRAALPGAANDLLKKIRILISFAIVNGVRSDDPTFKIPKFKGGEWHTWTEVEIAAFEKRWPVGSRERLAFALHLYTGQRVSDVSHMTDADIGTGMIKVTQIKTKAKVSIPMHPDLNTVLAATAKTPGALLKTSFGNQFTEKGLANFMADAIGKAEVPDHCVTHGLRKAAARRLAEARCTPHQIMAITGHTTLAEVERYTKAAEQERLAQSAIDLLPVRLPAPKAPNPSDGLGKTVKNFNQINAESDDWRTGQDETANTYVIEIAV